MAKVNWTFHALENLDDIATYIANNSEKYASYLVTIIMDRTEHLADHPEMGRVVPEMGINSIRELIIKNYRVIYSLPDIDTVDIIAVRSSRQPLGDLDT